MRIAEFQKKLNDFALRPSPGGLVCICEGLMDSLFTAQITLKQAWRIQEKIDYLGGSPEVSCNIIRITHITWEILEAYAELSQEHDEYPLSTLQNALTELQYALYDLKTSGWESVYPYMRAYYEKRQAGRVIASLALTSFMTDRGVRAYTGETTLHKKLSDLVTESMDLQAVEKALPSEIAGWVLRNVVHGHALVSDFEGVF